MVRVLWAGRADPFPSMWSCFWTYLCLSWVGLRRGAEQLRSAGPGVQSAAYCHAADGYSGIDPNCVLLPQKEGSVAMEYFVYENALLLQRPWLNGVLLSLYLSILIIVRNMRVRFTVGRS